jgi:drug/metabolite transporter (DMT)-like permease
MPATRAAVPRATYLTGALWGLFAISIWVGWILLTRFGVTTSLSPFDITALRFGCAGALLLPIVIRNGFAVRQVGLPLSIVSLFAYAKAVGILGASLGSSFASLVPVLAMLAAIPLLGEVPRPVDYFGIAAITVGVFLSSGAYQAFVPAGMRALGIAARRPNSSD